MRWLDVNVHFSVLTIVYLDAFLCLIVIALLSYFKGHMKIQASVLYHKSHYSESYHQHSISNGISIAKMSFFSCKMFFFLGKNRKPISNAPQYYFFCLVIWYQYHFDTITHFSTISYPSIQRHPFLFQKNGCLNFWKHPSIIVLEIIATKNIFGDFPVKHSCWSPF